MKPFRPICLLLVVCLLALAAGCGAPPTVPGTPTVQATATAVAPSPANTAEPSATAAAPTPSATSMPPSPTGTASPTDTPRPSRAAGIIFLGADGSTAWRANTDGSGAEILFSIDLPEQGSVRDLSAGPSGKQVVYGVARGPEDHQPVYYIWSEDTGTAKEIAPLSGAPHWSPDGQSLVGQTFSASGFGGPIYLYGVSSGRGLRLPAEGTPDFYPGPRQILYVFKDNIYSYDLDGGLNVQLTYLPNDDQNAWTVQEAHVLPGGKQIAFFGGQFRKDGELVLGAQGNGQQWWAIPVEGGEGHPLTEPSGNTAVAYSAAREGGLVALVDSAHSSACISVHSLQVVNTQDGKVTRPDVRELQEQTNGAAEVRGITWSPDGTQLAFGVQSYTCPEDGSGRLMGTATIYVWDVASSALRKVAEGTYPTWVAGDQ